jgi:hypothetical protein
VASHGLLVALITVSVTGAAKPRRLAASLLVEALRSGTGEAGLMGAIDRSEAEVDRGVAAELRVLLDELGRDVALRA